MADERKDTTTEVEIFGTVYPVRAVHDDEHLRELAEVVDDRMERIAARVATADTARIAILAALNLADELHECQRQQGGELGEIVERVTHLNGVLRESLAE